MVRDTVRRRRRRRRVLIKYTRTGPRTESERRTSIAVRGNGVTGVSL